MNRWFAVVAATLLLQACASTSHCRSALPYQSAPDHAPLVGTDGQPLPESAAALRIPPPQAGAAPFGQKNGDQWTCLDIPPRLEAAPKS